MPENAVASKLWRVVGPPGTGKTTYLSEQIDKAAAAYDGRVLVTSFTRAAATELVRRDLALSRENVGTLHALCYHEIGYPPLAQTEDALKSWNAEHPEYHLTGKSDEMDDPYGEHEGVATGDQVMSEMEVLRARMVNKELWPSHVQRFAKVWEDWKSNNGLMDFTDLIEFFVYVADTVPLDPLVLCADESQDNSALENTLIHRWGAQMDHFIMAGDPWQSIFGFKGADPETFLQPDLPPEQVRVLSQSYRLPRRVHAFATRWIRQHSNYQHFEYQPRDEEGAVLSMPNVWWKQPEGMLPLVERCLADGKTVMIAASCSYLLRPTIAVLRQAGLPFQNPWRTKRRDWNPLAQAHASATSSVSRLLSYLRPQVDAWGDRARSWTPADLKLWTETITQKGNLLGKRDAIDGLGVPVDTSLGIGNLARLLAPEALLAAIAGNLDWYEARLLAEYRKRMEFPIAVVRNRGAAELREAPMVYVGTGHSFKGSEADWCLVYPDLSPAGMGEWYNNKDTVLRLFYVMCTRAREGLVLLGTQSPQAVQWKV